MQIAVFASVTVSMAALISGDVQLYGRGEIGRHFHFEGHDLAVRRNEQEIIEGEPFLDIVFAHLSLLLLRRTAQEDFFDD